MPNRRLAGLMAVQRPPTGLGDVVGFISAFFGLTDTKLNLCVRHVARLLPTSIHLCCLDTDFLGDVLLIVLVALIDFNVAIASLGNVELQIPGVAQMLPTNKIVFFILLVLDGYRLAGSVGDVDSTD